MSRLPFLVAGPSGVVLGQRGTYRYNRLKKPGMPANRLECANVRGEPGKAGLVAEETERTERTERYGKRTGETGLAAGRLSYLSYLAKARPRCFSYCPKSRAIRLGLEVHISSRGWRDAPCCSDCAGDSPSSTWQTKVPMSFRIIRLFLRSTKIFQGSK